MITVAQTTTTTIQNIVVQVNEASPGFWEGIVPVLLGALAALAGSYLFWALGRKDEQRARRDDRVHQTRLLLASIATRFGVLVLDVDCDITVTSASHPEEGTNVFNHRWSDAQKWEDRHDLIASDLYAVHTVHIREKDFPEGQADEISSLLIELVGEGRKLIQLAYGCAEVGTDNNYVRKLYHQKTLLKGKLEELSNITAELS